MNHPRSLRDLRMRLSSEQACRDLLFELRWPDGFVCSRCHGRKAWTVDGTLYECASCGLQTSVTAGTIFQNTRAPLSLWLRVIWWITGQTRLTTASSLQRISGHSSYETAWTWLQKLRRAMVPRQGEKLRGVVELGYVRLPVGRKPHHPGEGFREVTIAVAVQAENSGIGPIRIRSGVKTGNLQQFIESAVAKHSVLVTPPLFPVRGLGGLGYIQERPQPRQGKKEVETPPRVEAVVSELTQWLHGLKTRHQITHLQSWIDEFVYQHNSRRLKNRGQRFVDLLRRAVMASPHPGPHAG